MSDAGLSHGALGFLSSDPDPGGFFGSLLLQLPERQRWVGFLSPLQQQGTGVIQLLTRP